jgi:hypothetical protein
VPDNPQTGLHELDCLATIGHPRRSRKPTDGICLKGDSDQTHGSPDLGGPRRFDKF